ncbi:MAG: aminotransferase class I/II-fold pyridoxal phosphate-dependent enzyme [Candidatus Eisenbacteria bacterium]
MKSTEDGMKSKRLRDLPVYLFEDLAVKRRQKAAEGIDVIDLSIGDPDLGAPACVIEALCRHAADRRLHCYTPYWAVETFNQTVSGWMAERFGVDLDPSSEIMPVIGTKEGIAHLPLAVLDPGDVALVPDPGYPVYSRGVWFAGGRVEWMPLRAGTGYLPDTESLEMRDRRLVYLNYPNNPTSAVAEIDFYEAIVDRAREANAIVVSDAAYSETTFDGYQSRSLLEVPRAGELAVEFHSLSKTFGMAGWRVGFAAGNERIISALGALKSNIDSGVFGAVLLAAAEAIENAWPAMAGIKHEYTLRRSLIRKCLETCGLEYHNSPATLYIWAKVPGEETSIGFATTILEEAGVLVAPGVGFGECGEGYFRISVTCPTDRIKTAMERIQKVSERWMT